MESVISYGGTLPFEMESPQWRVSEDGWDTGRSRWFVTEGASFDLSDYFARGEAHPRYAKMHVVGVDWTEHGDGTWLADVEYRGLASKKATVAKAYKRKIYNNTQTTSGANITTTDFTSQKAEVKEPLLSVQDQWISESEPSTAISGTAQTPADAPTPAAFLWASLSDAVFLYPSGWVLESREIDPIEGASVWFVVDTYVYYYAKKAGDI